MLGDITGELAELGVVLDKALHVGYRFELRIGLILRRKLLHIILCVLA